MHRTCRRRQQLEADIEVGRAYCVLQIYGTMAALTFDEGCPALADDGTTADSARTSVKDEAEPTVAASVYGAASKPAPTACDEGRQLELPPAVQMVFLGRRPRPEPATALAAAPAPADSQAPRNLPLS